MVATQGTQCSSNTQEADKTTWVLEAIDSILRKARVVWFCILENIDMLNCRQEFLSMVVLPMPTYLSAEWVGADKMGVAELGNAEE